MKITASRKDDILKRKAEYEAKDNAYREARDKASQRYRDDRDTAIQPTIDAIKAALGDDLGDLNISVYDYIDNTMRVEISNGSSPRREDYASLTWRWMATLNKDGEIKKESSSWSGLDATTYDQIEDLKQCVRQLEIINNLDWKTLLDISLPDYEDYTVKDVERPGDRPNFEQELLEAEIEDCIGEQVLIKGKSGSGRYYYGVVYYGIVKDSGSQYTVFEVSGNYINAVLNGDDYAYSDTLTLHNVQEVVDFSEGNEYRVRKSKFIDGLVKPLSTVEY